MELYNDSIKAWTYDDANRLITETINTGVGNLTTTFGYDDAGNRTSVTKPVTGTTTYSYNNLDQITREDRADGSFETYTYDARGNLVQVNCLAPGLCTSGSEKLLLLILLSKFNRSQIRQ